MNDITNSYIKYKKLELGSGRLEISFNTVSFFDNLSNLTMKDFNDLKRLFLRVLETNDAMILDITKLDITNSSGIALLTILAKSCRLEYHKNLKIFFNSDYDWQVKTIVNIFKMAGPVDIQDCMNKVTAHSITNKYYSFI